MYLQVRQAYRKKFKIPDEEIADLEMDVSDVNFELEACKKYLEEAERVIDMLKSDANQEVARHGIKLVAGAAGATAATIVIGAAGTQIILYNICKQSQVTQYAKAIFIRSPFARAFLLQLSLNGKRRIRTFYYQEFNQGSKKISQLFPTII